MLKKEARILGLSGSTIRGKIIIVSVVFRGSLWLDGVATSTMDARERNWPIRLSSLIRRSKQFSQLHAIMISRRLIQSREISIQNLAKRVRLPIIAIETSNESRIQGVKNFDLSVAGKHVRVSAAGVDRENAERLYRVGCSPSLNIPEAVRIADLLAEQLAALAHLG